MFFVKDIGSIYTDWKTRMKIKAKLETCAKTIKDNLGITILVAIMAVIYAYVMFTNKPWYDELYTYYSFISRGPVYAAIHWPVPNNHVGYSVLSACLDIFGNPYIGLRGVSYLASLANMILIYRLTDRFMKREYALSSVVLYVCANLVFSLSVQGRGYTLATTCYLMSILCCYHICVGEVKTRHYIGIALWFALGLYVLPSSLYWVLPICAVGGLFLLFRMEWKKFGLYFASAVAGALITLFLYTLIWLAIGSNLMCKNPENPYYGVYQVTIILKAPFAALKTGIDYMLATPYIQSIDRLTATRGMLGYFKELFDLYYANCGIALVIITISIILFCFWYGVKHFRNRRVEYWLALYLVVSLLSVPVMLLIQSVHPYKRVFSFYMVPIAIGIAYCLYRCMTYCLDEKYQKRVAVILFAIILVLGGLRFTSYDYRRPYADRENSLHEVFDMVDAKSIESIYYTDDFQKYVLKFYYDAEPEEKSLEEAQYVLVYREMLKPEIQSVDWPLMVTYDRDMLAEIFYHFEPIASNDVYEVYARK